MGATGSEEGEKTERFEPGALLLGSERSVETVFLTAGWSAFETGFAAKAAGLAADGLAIDKVGNVAIAQVKPCAIAI
jgi:hypothetical protein